MSQVYKILLKNFPFLGDSVARGHMQMEEGELPVLPLTQYTTTASTNTICNTIQLATAQLGNTQTIHRHMQFQYYTILRPNWTTDGYDG